MYSFFQLKFLLLIKFLPLFQCFYWLLSLCPFHCTLNNFCKFLKTNLSPSLNKQYIFTSLSSLVVSLFSQYRESYCLLPSCYFIFSIVVILFNFATRIATYFFDSTCLFLNFNKR